MQFSQDVCSAIFLFYSAILKFKRKFDHEKCQTRKNEDDNFFAPKIPKLS